MQPTSVRFVFDVLQLLRTVSLLPCVTGVASAPVVRVWVYFVHTLGELVN